MNEKSKTGLTDKFRPPKTKVCRLCKQDKPVKEFARNIRGRSGYANECRTCNREQENKKTEQQKENAKTFFDAKYFTLFLLLSVSLTAFSQCDPSTFVFTLSPGITQSGAYFSMEAGIWPIEGRLGVMAGPLMYDEKVTTAKGQEKITQIDAMARVIYKLTRVGSNSPQLVTVFATARRLLGASYRAYWSIGQSELIGIEPMYVSRLGLGVNLLFTARL